MRRTSGLMRSSAFRYTFTRSRTVAAFGAVGMNSCQSLVTRYGAWFGWASTTSTSSR